MGALSKHFTEQIPAEHANVKMAATDKVLLLKPKFYILNQVTENVDYMFVTPTSTPPPIWIGKREYHYRKGRLVAFKPGISCLTKIDAPTREYLNISFNKDFFEDVVWEATGKRNVNFNEREFVNSPQLLQIIARFEDEVVNFTGSCPLMLQSISVQMVIEFLRCTGINTIRGPRENRPENSYVSKALEYMRAYYNAEINIEDICREINLSSFYFIRLFKAQTGKTPHEYLMDIRLEQAKALLQQGSTSVEETARLCGFVHPGHFSSFFRSNMGMTPSEYRKKHRVIVLKKN
ncbi:MAG: helix-turn-helix domain-containing protein [Peptococcaceae bacterium]